MTMTTRLRLSRTMLRLLFVATSSQHVIPHPSVLGLQQSTKRILYKLKLEVFCIKRIFFTSSQRIIE